jgi:hypothetical protein
VAPVVVLELFERGNRHVVSTNGTMLALNHPAVSRLAEMDPSLGCSTPRTPIITLGSPVPSTNWDIPRSADSNRPGVVRDSSERREGCGQ